MDLISIVVPIYNVEKYLEKCVCSIINQTYENLEIILVDDGSEDNSSYICDNFKENDTRIKVIHKKNGGLSDARNDGLKVATGKYIAFIDSDDYVENNYIEKMYNILKKKKVDIVVCNYFLVDENYKKKNESFSKFEKKLSNIEAIRLLLNQKRIKDYAWNKLYNIELFDDIKYPKGYLMEDLGTTYKLFCKAKSLYVIDDKLYYYLQRNGSILHNKSNKVYTDKYELAKDRYYNIRDIYGELEENIVSYFIVLLNVFPSFNNIDMKTDVINEIKKIFNSYDTCIKKYKKVYYKYCLYKFNKNLYSKIINIKGGR